MDDGLLAARAAAGDLDSYGQLYDRYFARVFDFAWRVLRDAGASGEVTREVFTRLRRDLPSVARGGDLNAWLFTSAHEAAVARAEAGPARAPRHEEAFGAFEEPDPALLSDPSVAAGEADLPLLVWEAVTALNPRDYAALDLHLRQKLGPDEMAAVLATSRGSAATMVARMQDAATGVIGGYVVARRRAPVCDGLQRALDEHEFPPYTEQVRRSVESHVAQCADCGAARAALPPVLDVFAALAPVAAPMALKGEVWREVAATWPGAQARQLRPAAVSSIAAAASGPARPYDASVASAAPPAPVLAAAGGFGGTVAPPPATTGPGSWGRGYVLWFAGAAAVLLLIAFGFGALLARALGDGGGNGGKTLTSAELTATAQRSVTAVTTITPGVTVPTATVNLTPSSTPTKEPPTLTPTAEPPTEVPPTEAPTVRPTNTPRNRTATPRATATPATPGAGGAATATCPPLQTC